MLRRALLWMVAVAVCVGWPRASEALEARISRPVVEERIMPGQGASGSIEVENQGDEPVHLTIYLQDWEYVEGGSGDKTFSPPGTSARSASGWIRYFPTELALAAHGTGVVEYTVQVPPTAVGGYYAVLFFEAVLGRSERNQNGVVVQYTGRLGSLFEIEAAGTIERTGEITAVTVGRPDEDRPLALEYRFRNTGNVVIRPKAYVNIIDQGGRYFGRGEFKPIYTSPGGTGSGTAEWTGTLPLGEYHVLLTVDLGDNQVLVSEQPLLVKREVAVEGIVVDGRDAARIGVELYNSGHVTTDVSGTLTLLSSAGATIGGWPLKPATLAPDHREQVPLAGSGSLGPGAYQCRVQLSYDGLTAERTVPCRVQ